MSRTCTKDLSIIINDPPCPDVVGLQCTNLTITIPMSLIFGFTYTGILPVTLTWQRSTDQVNWTTIATVAGVLGSNTRLYNGLSMFTTYYARVLTSRCANPSNVASYKTWANVMTSDLGICDGVGSSVCGPEVPGDFNYNPTSPLVYDNTNGVYSGGIYTVASNYEIRTCQGYFRKSRPNNTTRIDGVYTFFPGGGGFGAVSCASTVTLTDFS